MTGSVIRRGKNSWRLKFEIGRHPSTGERDTRYVTVRGSKKQAKEQLTQLLAARDSGSLVDPCRRTVREYLAAWINQAEVQAISGKTGDRYRALIEKQIAPHLGAILLQKLRPADIASWHMTLLRGGRVDGGPLSPQTVGHAHRVLQKSLNDALRHELVNRNVAAVVPPPKVPELRWRRSRPSRSGAWFGPFGKARSTRTLSCYLRRACGGAN
ncbi:MAG TPA: hypothetical protein VGU45_13635 [Microvirga sp.]|jgi:hypothetical protein|nr:hypothetical protein [Microvirga sp.]